MTTEPKKDQDGSGPPKGVPRWLLVASAALNVVLAATSGYTAWLKSELEREKQRLEYAILVRDNSPSLSMFYLISGLANLQTLIDKRDTLPFTADVSRFRVLENEQFTRLNSDLAEFRRGRQRDTLATFFVIANSGTAAAFTATVESATGRIQLGDIEAKTAVLIPMSLVTTSPTSQAAAQEYTTMTYETRLGSERQQASRPIPNPTTPSWMPTNGNLRGIGRASPEAQEDHLRDLVPETERGGGR